MVENEPKEYRWETGYEKTWEAIKEDNDGFLEASYDEALQRSKRIKLALQKQTGNKLGMMRHLYIILDCSEAMSSQDLKPTRILCTIKLLGEFVDEYFDQNPISQLGIIAMNNKRAEKISELGGNLHKHKKIISALRTHHLSGEPSLQNSLELALASLKLQPCHTSREMLVIMGSLTTCDPSEILSTIQTIKKEGMRCSVIGLAAEVHVCKTLATETGGTYNVVLDDLHFKDLLAEQITPPAATQNLESNLIKMGFPHQTNTESAADEPITMCMCHLDGADGVCKLSNDGYFCPQCYSKYCELPVECKVCNLTLVSAPHLARSYHHLFPVPNYETTTSTQDIVNCFACQATVSDKTVYQCTKCIKEFCIDCHLFVHETLHICPGCASTMKITT